jgi:hypothetical protein
MPDKTPDEWTDMALRQGLRDLDVPEPSPDFDARVLAAVRGRSPLREMFLSYLRPALATASVSAVATLLLVHWSTRPVPTVRAAEAPPVAASVSAEEGEAIMRRVLADPRPTYLAFRNMEDNQWTLRTPRS